MSQLHIYNSYNRQKELFEPITPGHVGLYVCGPTVSGESHLGHARPYITFDVVNRYLQHLGYKVRYVRNITDAGHFEEEGREAEDKVATKAILEKLEPMELVHKYTSLFHWGMAQFNCQEPSIEPTATGHIIEQIDMIEKIIEKGYAYEVNGSVYFDVKKYAESHPYGKLSGRIMDDLLETTRELEGQDEKRNKVDFALWKKAPEEHIMRWNSPWGAGFPGWHIECSAMSRKYLGESFDIHGGGMDLQFPHHESEIAQSTIAHDHPPVRYWMHNNMITINGKKMGKSYNNVIKLTELFSGNHPILEQAYHPMVVRFYILQTHYRSTLDFSNEALQASEKAFRRLWEAYEIVNKLPSLKLDTKSFEDGYYSKDNEIAVHLHSTLNQLYDLAFKTFSENYDSINFTHDWLYEKSSDIFNKQRIERPAQSELIDRVDNLVTSMIDTVLLDVFNDNLNVIKWCKTCENYMNDDLNTAKVIANLFELVPIINSIKHGQLDVSKFFLQTLELLQDTFKTYLVDIMGMQALQVQESNKLKDVMELLIEMRKEARTRKDFATSDQIRNRLASAGILLKDEKDGSVSYTIE